MRPDAFAIEATTSISDVQQPTHAYIGRNGNDMKVHHWYSAAVNASVRPVGPTKVIGCPASAAYAIPESPHETSTSDTPIAPPVSAPIAPPNAITGAKHAKNRNEIAASDLRVRPSRQSEKYSGAFRPTSSRSPRSHWIDRRPRRPPTSGLASG